MGHYKWKRFIVRFKSLFKETWFIEEFDKEDVRRESKDLANEILLHDIEIRFELLDKISERVKDKSIEEMEQIRNRLNRYEKVLQKITTKIN